MMRIRGTAARGLVVLAGGIAVVLAATLAHSDVGAATGAPLRLSPPGISKIKHVVVIMQENRSFDSYFGTYPRANGIPMKNGVPAVCVPDPASGSCIRPFHDPNDRNRGGPHGQTNAAADINGGKMDGFVAQAEQARKQCRDPNNPNCTSGGTGKPDVMGYHDAREIPNYWAYAKNFVLQDRMFEPNASWSLPAHLFMVSEWSALCSVPATPSSCVNALQSPARPPGGKKNPNGIPPDYAWTDLTYVLHAHHVSWGYYVFAGTEPDCADDAATCRAVPQNATTPGIWNPLPYFDTVKQDNQLGNIQPINGF
jgi:phospholipase C